MSKKLTVDPEDDHGPIKREQVKLVHKELQAMERENVPIRPKDLLERARPKNSKIHNLFDWDDEAAGERWRLEQSRRYIAAVITINIVTKKRARQYVPIIISTRSPARQYERREIVLEDTDKRAQLSAQHWLRLDQIIRSVRGHGLDNEQRWRRICSAFDVGDNSE